MTFKKQTKPLHVGITIIDIKNDNKKSLNASFEMVTVGC